MLIAVEAAILAALGVKSLAHRGGEESVQMLIKKAEAHFKIDPVTHHYRFPQRRWCWLLGPKDAVVLALLGE